MTLRPYDKLDDISSPVEAGIADINIYCFFIQATFEEN